MFEKSPVRSRRDKALEFESSQVPGLLHNAQTFERRKEEVETRQYAETKWHLPTHLLFAALTVHSLSGLPTLPLLRLLGRARSPPLSVHLACRLPRSILLRDWCPTFLRQLKQSPGLLGSMHLDCCRDETPSHRSLCGAHYPSAPLSTIRLPIPPVANLLFPFPFPSSDSSLVHPLSSFIASSLS